MSATGDGPQVGSVEHEAELLAAALGRANGHLRLVPEERRCPGEGQAPTRPDDATPERPDDRTPSCTGCPLCAGTDWVRRHGPEALRSLADATGLLAEGMRVLAAQLEDSRPSSGDGDGDTVREEPQHEGEERSCG